MVTETAIQECKNRMRGEVLCPEDEGYEVACKVFNAMIDKRPALIARCAGAADVIECVRFAREHDLVVSVRGGGHSVAGKAICDGGLMIDLSRLRGCLKSLGRREPTQHQTRHGEVHHGFTALRQPFIVFAQATRLVEPRQCAFDHPPTRQQYKALGPFGT